MTDDIARIVYPEPMQGDDDEIATSEGWGVFDSAGSDGGPWQIQRIDELEMFPSDDEAWVHVWTRAAEGSPVHRRALDYVREHNPPEYEAIERWCSKKGPNE